MKSINNMQKLWMLDYLKYFVKSSNNLPEKLSNISHYQRISINIMNLSCNISQYLAIVQCIWQLRYIHVMEFSISQYLLDIWQYWVILKKHNSLTLYSTKQNQTIPYNITSLLSRLTSFCYFEIFGYLLNE